MQYIEMIYYVSKNSNLRGGKVFTTQKQITLQSQGFQKMNIYEEYTIY